MTNLSNGFKVFLLGLIIAGISFTSCEKTEFIENTGMVTYYGDFATGGCGWVIEIGTKAYQMQNIPDAYLVDSLPVQLTYRVLEGAPDCLNRTDVNGIIYVHKIETVN